ncbi:MAG: ligase-associated DNA damage response endonuclease PdeM [Phycisphaerales bacterium]|nr:ligase-associated DNA damage response endonuclease PdeM [Phycisphaerales bacterium]
MTPITLAGEPVFLLPEKALWRPSTRTLIVADLHIGKAAAFRVFGIPVPEHSEADLARLTELTRRLDAARLVILGDFLHARLGRTPAVLRTLEAWRPTISADILLVRGNHDRSAGDPPDTLAITTVNGPHPDHPFAYTHEPPDPPASPTPAQPPSAPLYNLHGHLHPAALIQDAHGQRLRLPCFVISPQSATLPAFGSFTGARTARYRPTDRIYAIADHTVLDATAAIAR